LESSRQILCIQSRRERKTGLKSSALTLQGILHAAMRTFHTRSVCSWSSHILGTRSLEGSKRSFYSL
jgi:hypothetical protein